MRLKLDRQIDGRPQSGARALTDPVVVSPALSLAVYRFTRSLRTEKAPDAQALASVLVTTTRLSPVKLAYQTGENTSSMSPKSVTITSALRICGPLREPLRFARPGASVQSAQGMAAPCMGRENPIRTDQRTEHARICHALTPRMHAVLTACRAPALLSVSVTG